MANLYSFVCKDFKSYDNYSPIVFTFKGVTEEDVVVTLEPSDYIQQLNDDTYELLFKYVKSPQAQDNFIFGTSFFRKFYPIFNSDKGTITLREKFNVDVASDSMILDDRCRLPVIIIGIILALLVVVVLLVVILKKVQVEEYVDQSAGYGTYKPVSTPVYNQSSVHASGFQPVRQNYSGYQHGNLNVSAYQPTAINSVYNPANNAPISSQLLRQSQTQVRQSQMNVRESQTYQRNY